MISTVSRELRPDPRLAGRSRRSSHSPGALGVRGREFRELGKRAPSLKMPAYFGNLKEGRLHCRGPHAWVCFGPPEQSAGGHVATINEFHERLRGAVAFSQKILPATWHGQGQQNPDSLRNVGIDGRSACQLLSAAGIFGNLTLNSPPCLPRNDQEWDVSKINHRSEVPKRARN